MESKIKSKKRGMLIFNIIVSIIIILNVLLLLFVPNFLMVCTGRYGTGSEEENEFIDKVMGDDAEETFKLYFYWFNVIHETGHGIMMFNGNKNYTDAENEMLVNKFAAAYWRKYGEEDKLKKIEELADYALSKLDNPAKDGQSIVEWLNEHYREQAQNISFNDYGYFQFKSVKEAFECTDSLEEIVEEMTGKKVTLNDKKLTYEKIDEETSTQIILDASDNYREWGLNYPEHDMIAHYFVDQPNNHFATSSKSIVGILIPRILVILAIIMIVGNIIFFVEIKNLSKKK